MNPQTASDILVKNALFFLSSGIPTGEYISVNGVEFIVKKDDSGRIVKAAQNGKPCTRAQLAALNIHHNHNQHLMAIRRA